MTNLRNALFAFLAAHAAILPAQDDRDRTTPTAAVWYTNQSSTGLQNLVNQGWRVTDIGIESTSPWSFTIAAVPNTGAYAKAWWYAIGVTAAQLSASLAQNNARLIDLEPYDAGGGVTLFVALMISNTGADAKSWWWYYNQSNALVNSTVTANNGRLTSLRRYTVGSQTYFASVMISNTGADYRAWGYFYGASTATINQNIAQYGNRIYAMHRVAADSYDVILLPSAGFGNWYYFDLPAAGVTEVLQQNLGRAIEIARYVTSQGIRFDVVMLDDANPLEAAARQQFYAALPGALGKYGFYLEAVNGPVLAQMRPDTVFEPASTMKTLYHVHAMRQVLLGNVSLSTMLNKPLACGVPGANQTLELTLREMMENSDNMSTLAVSNYFGIANINATAAALGMASTHVNFTIGCTGPSPENQLTLHDLGLLHEQVANGYLGSQRAEFYELMEEGLAAFPTWGSVSLDARINSESAALGLPNVVRDAFKAALHIAYKPGGIGYNGNFYYAEGGWMSVPFKNAAGVITPQEFTFGVFDYLFNTQEISGRTAMSAAELAIVWDRVDAALLTWDHHLSGSIVALPGAGCAGSAGTPLHTATGNPELGNTVLYSVSNAPGSSLAEVIYGFSNTLWNSTPLPYDLGAVGAPGCPLRVQPVIVDSGFTQPGGVLTKLVSFANNPAFLNLQFYTQFLVLDPAANRLGWTVSNATRTTLGGWW